MEMNKCRQIFLPPTKIANIYPLNFEILSQKNVNNDVLIQLATGTP